MDTTKLIIWLMGVVMISIGLPLFYLGRYFRAPADEKKQKARDVQIIAIMWMAAGVVIYIGVLISILVAGS
jgi:formate hydrogenlyase subunit 3/multisubunit Na+/H+ antiporter MnhD subunit